MVIEAKTQDGSPAQKGDSVLCVWGGRYKCVGRINKVNGQRTFVTMQNKAELYALGLDDYI